MRRICLILLAAAAPIASSPAAAADALKFGSPPAWVVPEIIPAPSDKAKDRPIALLLHDQQTMLEPGRTSTFSELAFKIQKPEGLAAGNLSIAWNPATDTVTINTLEIRRGEQVIDVLKSGQTFTTLRRESNLDLATLDGVLTANIQPEGLQEGDVVVLATTTDHADPVLKGHVEATFAPWGDAQIALAHARLSWPSTLDVKIQKTGDLPAVQQSVRDGKKIYELTMRDVDPVIDPKGAPVRFQIGRMGEATDFRSWADAARLMIPLYRAAAVIPASGPLRDEVETIRKASADSKVRAEQALQLVQQRVRYVALVMGQGGYVPAPAEMTWSRRFGDCKAKTALLLAILHELGIEAQPVVVNANIGDIIADRLPSIGMFNHVLVRAQLAGRTYWLDGTRTGDTSLDRIKVPSFGWGLPLVENAALVHIVPPPLHVPDSETRIAIDATAGVFAPAKIELDEVLRGDGAVGFDNGYSQLSAEQRTQFLHENAKRYFDSISADSSTVAFDKERRELRISTMGAAKLEWKDGWFSVPSTSIGYNPDLDRPAGPQHDAPFATNYPNFDTRVVAMKLPRGFAAGQKKLPSAVRETLAAVEYVRALTLAGDTLKIQSSERSIAPEITYKEALAAQSKLKELSDNDVYLQVPTTYAATDKDVTELTRQTPSSSNEYYMRAGAYLARNNADNAIADLTAGLELDPNNVWALTKRAAAYIVKERLVDAEKDLQAAEAIEPSNSDVMAERGEIAAHKGDFSAALAAYGKAIDYNPKNSWARLRRAYVLSDQGKQDQALREVELVLAAEPRNISALAQRAQIFASKQDWTSAEKDVAAALAADPTDSTALATKAMIAVWRKDYKTGLELVGQALASNPSNSYARTLQAQLLKREGNQGEAMRNLDEAVSRAPRDASPLLDRAFAHLEAKDYEAAEKDVADALQIAPGDLRALEARSSIAMARGEYAAAIETLTAALKTFPSNGSALEARAEAYRQLRQYDSALADTEAALKTGHVSPSLRLLRINILLQRGDLEPVAVETDQLIKENPTSDFAWVVAGKTYAAIGMRQKAMESFDRAIAIKPYSYIYINRSQARPYSDMAGKLADLDAALKLEPDQEDALAEKARLLSKQGKHAEAIELYDRAIKTALDGTYLKLGRAIALQRAGRLAEAKEAFAFERTRSKTAGDFNRLCWTKAVNDVLLQPALEDCREALRMDPNYWPATDSLGMILLKLGKLKEALGAYDKALAHQSGANGYMGRAIVYARMGDLQHARADALQARKLRPDVDDDFADYGLKFDEVSAKSSQ